MNNRQLCVHVWSGTKIDDLEMCYVEIVMEFCIFWRQQQLNV